MVQSEFNTIILKADEGKYLTQLSDVNIENRVVASTIAIGKNDSPNNWKEITKEEADAIIKAQEELRNNK